MTLDNIYIDSVYHNKGYYRAKIVSYIDDRYILQDININNINSVPEDEIFHAASIAKKYRLYGVCDSNQEKTIEEIMKDIPSNEYISMIIERADAEYLFVTLVRENNDDVNDHYRSDNTTT